ncbi:hypothetical protein [Nocardiopsis sp. LOL_012]|uniref:hypothetical protein n=1 Tax=Nocardiopsis sp. LOL_012 TaxID=3345409 RepID=UPI003A85EFE7
MADVKESPQKKQGLHGWKAAGAVFGCGTLAAFGVFGAFVGVVALFIDATSSGLDLSSGDFDSSSAEQIGDSRSSLGLGEMNVCDENLEFLSTVNVTRQDSGDDYVDTSVAGDPGIEGASRVVRDECYWEIIPEGGATPWNFEFKYEAIIDAEGGESAEGIAMVRFDDLRSDVNGEFDSVESEVSGGFGEDSYSVYGVGVDGESTYVALVRTRSAVYRIRFSGQGESSVGEISENAFMNEARKITNFLGYGFQYWIPE